MRKHLILIKKIELRINLKILKLKKFVLLILFISVFEKN